MPVRARKDDLKRLIPTRLSTRQDELDLFRTLRLTVEQIERIQRDIKKLQGAPAPRQAQVQGTGTTLSLANVKQEILNSRQKATQVPAIRDQRKTHVQAYLDGLNEDVKNLRATVLGIQSKGTEALETKIDALWVWTGELKQSNRDRIAEINTVTQRTVLVENLSAHLESKVLLYQERIKKAEARIAQEAIRVVELQGQFKLTSAQTALNTKEIARINKVIAGHAAIIDELYIYLYELGQEIENLPVGGDPGSGTGGTVPGDLADLIVHLENQIIALQQAINTLQSWQNSINQTMSSINTSVQNLQNTTSALLAWQEELGGTIATIESSIDDHSATLALFAGWQEDVDTTLAAVVLTASANEASIQSIAVWQGETDQAIAAIQQTASDNEAAISLITVWQGETDTTIAAIQQSASETEAEIQILASFQGKTQAAIVTDTGTFTEIPVTELPVEIHDNATIWIRNQQGALVSYTVAETATVGSTFIEVTSSAEVQQDDPVFVRDLLSLAFTRHRADENEASIQSLVTWQNEAVQTIAGLELTTTEHEAEIQLLAAYQGKTKAAEATATGTFTTIPTTELDIGFAAGAPVWIIADTGALVEREIASAAEVDDTQIVVTEQVSVEAGAGIYTLDVLSLAYIRQRADANSASITSLVAWQGQINTSIGDLEQDVEDLETELQLTATALASFQQEVAQDYAQISALASYTVEADGEAVSTSLAGWFATVDENQAQISIQAQHITDQGDSIAGIQLDVNELQSTVIIMADTDGSLAYITLSGDPATGSSINLGADQINLEGLVQFFNDPANGITTIDGGRITTGTITAAQINVMDLFAQDVVITGSLSMENALLNEVGIEIIDPQRSQEEDGTYEDRYVALLPYDPVGLKWSVGDAVSMWMGSTRFGTDPPQSYLKALNRLQIGTHNGSFLTFEADRADFWQDVHIGGRLRLLPDSPRVGLDLPSAGTLRYISQSGPGAPPPGLQAFDGVEWHTLINDARVWTVIWQQHDEFVDPRLIGLEDLTDEHDGSINNQRSAIAQIIEATWDVDIEEVIKPDGSYEFGVDVALWRYRLEEDLWGPQRDPEVPEAGSIKKKLEDAEVELQDQHTRITTAEQDLATKADQSTVGLIDTRLVVAEDEIIDHDTRIVTAQTTAESKLDQATADTLYRDTGDIPWAEVIKPASGIPATELDAIPQTKVTNLESDLVTITGRITDAEDDINTHDGRITTAQNTADSKLAQAEADLLYRELGDVPWAEVIKPAAGIPTAEIDGLADVATTGSWDDITDKPDIAEDIRVSALEVDLWGIGKDPEAPDAGSVKHSIQDVDDRLDVVEIELPNKADTVYVNNQLASKADTSTVTTLADRVTDAETDITQHDGRITTAQNTADSKQSSAQVTTAIDSAFTTKNLSDLDSGANTKLSGIAAGATVGAQAGTNLYAANGTTLLANADIITNLGTAADTASVNGIAAATVSGGATRANAGLAANGDVNRNVPRVRAAANLPAIDGTSGKLIKSETFHGTTETPESVEGAQTKATAAENAAKDEITARGLAANSNFTGNIDGTAASTVRADAAAGKAFSDASDIFSASGDYTNLRARATLKADVGLSNVNNVAVPLPSGNGGRYLRVNSGGTGYETRTAANTRADLSLGSAALLQEADVRLTSNLIGSSDIADGAITEGKVGQNVITGFELAGNAVDTQHIAGLAVQNTKIATGAVIESKIFNGAVTQDKIGPNAVVAEKIASGAVIESKIFNGAVTQDKIGASAVTVEKLASQVQQDISNAIKLDSEGFLSTPFELGSNPIVFGDGAGILDEYGMTIHADIGLPGGSLDGLAIKWIHPTDSQVTPITIKATMMGVNNTPQLRFENTGIWASDAILLNANVSNDIVVSGKVRTPVIENGFGSNLTVDDNLIVNGVVTANTPTLDTHLATKAYVDNLAAGKPTMAAYSILGRPEATGGLSSDIVAPANSVLVRSTAVTTTGEVGFIAASNDQVLRRSGSGVLTFGTLVTSNYANATSTSTGVTAAKLQHLAATSILGRSANSTGVQGQIAATASGQVLRRSGTTLSFGTIDNESLASGTYINITGTGALNAGSIVSGFGNINIGGNSLNAGTLNTQGAIAAGGNISTAETVSGGVGSFDSISAGSVKQTVITAGRVLQNVTVVQPTLNGEIANKEYVDSVAAGGGGGGFGLAGENYLSLNTSTEPWELTANPVNLGTSHTTGTVPTAKIANQAVTYAKIQNVGSGTILGRTAGGSGSVTALTTLPNNVMDSITRVGTLNVGAITSGFGNINIGTSTFTGGQLVLPTSGMIVFGTAELEYDVMEDELFTNSVFRAPAIRTTGAGAAGRVNALGGFQVGSQVGLDDRREFWDLDGQFHEIIIAGGIITSWDIS